MRKIKTISFFFILTIVLSGCITVSKQDLTDVGGFFRSSDLGETWQRKNILYTLGNEAATFNRSNINKIIFDYNDQGALYLASNNDGILYSYNYGEGWFNSLYGQGNVNDLVIDSNNKCLIYAALHNTIYKTSDCSRHWDSLYFETGDNQFITTLNINYNNSHIIYAGTSGGDLLKSTNAGISWKVIKRFENSIKKILVQNILAQDIIYVATQSSGLYKSSNNDQEWVNLMDLEVSMIEREDEESIKFGEVKDAQIVLDLELDKSVEDGLIYANKIGIFRLLNGLKWQQLKLLTAPNEEKIYEVIVNDGNGQEIIYLTSQALYHSLDAGLNWQVKSLPSSQKPGELRFSPDGQYLYLGVYKIK